MSTLRSPLEELSQAYLKPKDFNLKGSEKQKYWNDRIIDDTVNQRLYIIPAGYTQRDSNGTNRRVTWRKLWEKAVELDSEREIYPLGYQNTHQVILRPEPSNQYDPYAIKVGIRFDDIGKTPDGFRTQLWYDIGYIPKLISNIITSNCNMVTRGRLIGLYAEHPKDIYYGRIVLPYGEPKPTSKTKCNTKRFSAILEE